MAYRNIVVVGKKECGENSLAKSCKKISDAPQKIATCQIRFRDQGVWQSVV